jgi:shikimate dehydrogenase
MIEKMRVLRTDQSEDHCNLVGLIGLPGPLQPTLELFNAAFRMLGMNWRYVLLPVDPGKLREALLGLRALGFVGAEVTGAFQTEAPTFLEELTPAARDIGAVSLLEVASNGSLVGDNTQCQGFLASLQANSVSLVHRRPLIIGAGVAARNVVYALAREGMPLTIVDRDIARAIDLVHDLRHVMDEHSFSIYRWPHDLEQLAPKVDLIVNTTHIGAWPDAAASPWPDSLPIAPGSLVYDLVPWPLETAFLKHAKRYGARTVNGLAMLVCQSALIFERWTRRSPPIRQMWRVGTRALRRKTMLDLSRSGRLVECPFPVQHARDAKRIQSAERNCVPASRSGYATQLLEYASGHCSTSGVPPRAV